MAEVAVAVQVNQGHGAGPTNASKGAEQDRAIPANDERELVAFRCALNKVGKGKVEGTHPVAVVKPGA